MGNQPLEQSKNGLEGVLMFGCVLEIMETSGMSL